MAGHNDGFLKLVNAAKLVIKECTVSDVWRRLQNKENFFFIDVREDGEWKMGRAKSAMHIGRGVLERDIETLIPDKSAPIVLYCGGGFRSALAAESLKKMGYQDVTSMDGGIRLWREQNLPEDHD